ncbi:hypothetical protein ASC78_23860 [Variovorax sp. Root318D1]|uniref:DUF4214 domain-containing protein n=1 Tax=Variovorax sp. Root318D1 TaxID=1736513 RepID=UPI0006FD8716|nr:DUF4214 domain-containing protein [Variovorax sp. Root318D1]KQU88737.1 hypothetical protein ASC78_23860 [Variovorax sp. Root318D1]
MPVLTGTDGKDLLQGTEGDDTIDGLRGDDLIFGNGGNDTINGGWGNDYVLGGVGDDIIRGGGGTDPYAPLDFSLPQDRGSKYFFGEEGNDTLYGGVGNDYLLGGIGDDTIITQSSSGYVVGGPGADVLHHVGFASDGMYLEYGEDAGGVSVDLLAGRAVDGWGDIDSVSGFIAVDGSLFDDVLIGGAWLNGSAGNDVLISSFSNATLLGGPGDDRLDASGFGSNDSVSTGAIYRLYRAALNREPDVSGMEHWRRAMDRGFSAESVADGFLSSSEFQTTYGALDNRTFVALLYRNVLHREPDAGGLSSWVASLDAGASRAGVLLGFSASAEFQASTALDQEMFLNSKYGNAHRGEVYRLYQAAFDRAPDVGGYAAWVALLDSGKSSLGEIAQAFTNSSEFQSMYKNLDNTQFVTQLYANVLDRAPEPAGLAGWVGALGAGASRADVLRGFSESSELRTNSLPGMRVWLEQSSGHSTIVGGPGSDVLIGGAGADTFDFYSFDAQQSDAPTVDHVYGFESTDTLGFRGSFSFASMSDVYAMFQQQGTDVVMSLSPTSTVTFHNTTLTQVTQAGFAFGPF